VFRLPELGGFGNPDVLTAPGTSGALSVDVVGWILFQWSPRIGGYSAGGYSTAASSAPRQQDAGAGAYFFHIFNSTASAIKAEFVLPSCVSSSSKIMTCSSVVHCGRVVGNHLSLVLLPVVLPCLSLSSTIE
jgi:hypothetical protein